MAAVGVEIATDLGNPTASNWFVASWVVSITVAFMLAGANTDMLGRRWFLIAGQFICTIGHLIVGTAQSNPQVIAGTRYMPQRNVIVTDIASTGMTVAGLGAALCQMAAFALPELLPNKWRHIGVVLADLAVYFTIIVIPVTARFGYYAGDWRGNFYAAAIMQAISAAGLWAFYYPPAHPLGIPFRQAIRELDYLGMFLFVSIERRLFVDVLQADNVCSCLQIAGSLPVLVGIVYTATLPASDPRVVATLVVGFVFLIAFAIWETYGTAKHPLTPPIAFKRSHGRDFTAPCIALAIINMFYYSSSIIWPTMIASFYTLGGQPWRQAAIYSLPQGVAITVGAMGLTYFGSKIRHWQWQQTISVTVMVIFGSLLALATPDNFGLMCAMLILSMLGYGWAIYLTIAYTQMGVPQEQLGISGGLSGCVRFAGGSIAQAVYLTVFQNDVAQKTPVYVTRAALEAGVPQSKITQLLGELTDTEKLTADFGGQVVAAVGYAQQLAVAHGIKLIALTSLGFGVVGIIACLCCKDVDHKMNETIEVFLENDEFADRNKYH
jgi:MFS family permease